MASHDRPLSPHLMVYRWRWTMSLSILHRMSGVAISVAAFGVAWWLLALAGGSEGYETFRACLVSPLGLLALVAFGAGLVFHFLNGIRHLLWDTGWGLDLKRAFATAWVVIALALLLTAALAFAILRAGGAA
ncbi:MAG TPA: succinate dehydrogenase, cytochrome b556 subunit [Xanthomonadaceae bacterium]|nr:succinate dehydrogenase, cytochrome b556 subunit [Xanthomonadaceae bacterium]